MCNTAKRLTSCTQSVPQWTRAFQLKENLETMPTDMSVLCWKTVGHAPTSPDSPGLPCRPSENEQTAGADPMDRKDMAGHTLVQPAMMRGSRRTRTATQMPPRTHPQPIRTDPRSRQ